MTEQSTDLDPGSSRDMAPSTCPFDYLLVLDFEATCERERTPKPQEIIEFPIVVIDVAAQTVLDTEFHHYIRPGVHPTLSDFCTELTGITQDQVDQGISLEEALVLAEEFLQTVIPEGKTACFVTCGAWDFQTCLLRQSSMCGIVLPKGRMWKQFINIKHEFQAVTGEKGRGMVGMLDEMKLTLEGRHHSGIDDTRNIARLALALMRRGADFSHVTERR